MKRWYRWETTEDARKDAFCRHLRRQRVQHETKRDRQKHFRPGQLGKPREIWAVAMWVNEDELAEAQEWLRTH
jgi:hypothetical protein